ncbi:maleylpyruvate isomerase family mycothiol-dependent enzyme [Saccharopolyspora sp. WRP15-2]|uniref:Maleylpyruvate isomerase family mycothiol-dependent enzyme n=1 Tax=Saccharopolyspora oryzae TaxID=2997343 RepID=A0ABT4V3R1_9PSEU|nr:maleylpyruvate isomerase family mycothiol-dependent enzyme [Saccharopolyspora oryzae]MDA3628044.1 maleylpyruvate isomerase family mycothiol-dependent enzyme [Saccharopolyspora oryzae]
MDSEMLNCAFPEQAAAFRSAALQAGPNAQVSTCPGWDVRRLVQHLGQAYARAELSLHLEPGAPRPEVPRPPAEFDDVLTWWDERLADLRHTLSTMDPSRPVRALHPGGTPATWTRRMAHESAIHRLDAEHALAGLGPDHVHDLIFDPELAADGIDEFLTVILPLGDWSGSTAQGQVLVHAADAGRAWLVEFHPGEPPRAGAATGAALEVDATIAGTADAVYRKVWGRPSTAALTGNAALTALINGR